MILRWAGSQIAHTYQAIIAGLEAQLNEKDERLSDRTLMVENEHSRVLEEIAVERRRTAEEQRKFSANASARIQPS